MLTEIFGEAIHQNNQRFYLLYRFGFVISPIGIYQKAAALKPGLNLSSATLA